MADSDGEIVSCTAVGDDMEITTLHHELSAEAVKQLNGPRLEIRAPRAETTPLEMLELHKDSIMHSQNPARELRLLLAKMGIKTTLFSRETETPTREFPALIPASPHVRAWDRIAAGSLRGIHAFLHEPVSKLMRLNDDQIMQRLGRKLVWAHEILREAQNLREELQRVTASEAVIIDSLTAGLIDTLIPYQYIYEAARAGDASFCRSGLNEMCDEGWKNLSVLHRFSDVAGLNTSGRSLVVEGTPHLTVPVALVDAHRLIDRIVLFAAWSASSSTERIMLHMSFEPLDEGETSGAAGVGELVIENPDRVLVKHLQRMQHQNTEYPEMFRVIPAYALHIAPPGMAPLVRGYEIRLPLQIVHPTALIR